MTPDEKRTLRSKHTCTLKATSIGCRACDLGIPYPAMTVEEIIESLGAGRREREAAEKTTKRRGRY